MRNAKIKKLGQQDKNEQIDGMTLIPHNNVGKIKFSEGLSIFYTDADIEAHVISTSLSETNEHKGLFGLAINNMKYVTLRWRA